jgi:hypothetical protein
MDVNGHDQIPLKPEEGATEMIIKAEEGRVVIRFREPRLWIAFDAQNAVQIGKHLIDCAVECGAQIEIKIPRRTISDEKRNAMIVRALHIARSMEEKHKKPEVIAMHVVDSILASID